MSTGFKPNIFALVIGIDAYEYDPKFDLRPLKKATDDSENIKNWLAKLAVPDTQVRVLQNKDATRDAIIRALIELSEDPSIQEGDPILIYYAGHGSQVDAPQEWNWDTPQIQMILPCDYTGNDRVTHGIPDRTLGSLLSQIAEKKGNNITVILDCCHSGSGTRSGTQSDLRARSVPYEGSIPANLDEDIVILGPRARGFQVHDRFRNAGCRSHVLLAACAPNEVAYEDRDSGVFTRALLEAFGSLDMTKTSNVDLLKHMNIQNQTPQCEGHFRSRFLFDGKVSNSAPVYPASFKNNKLTIEAGAFHGIQKGCKFGIWKSKDDLQKRHATTVTVDTVQGFRSIADYANRGKLSRMPPSGFFAQILDNPQPELRVHVPDAIKKMEWFETLFDSTKHGPPLKIDAFANKAQASVGLTFSKDKTKIGFEILTPGERDQEIGYTIPPQADVLYDALRHLSHYFYHRNRVGSSNPRVGDTKEVQVPLSSKIKFVMFTLKETANEGEYERGEEEVDLLTDGTPLPLTVGEENESGFYGFEITNMNQFNVFPHLFYFNDSNFSIAILYSPTAETKSVAAVPSPLAASRSLTIGYGSEGFKPLSYTMSDPDAKLERGCFRLFVPTIYADLGFMKQGGISQGTSRGFGVADVPSGMFWDCITIPTVVRKEEAPPTLTIGIIGSKHAKATFVQELFKSLKVSDIEPSSESPKSLVKGYDINIDIDGSQTECTLVDFPAFEDAGIHNQAETLKELDAWLASQSSGGEKREFVSLIWCYDISSLGFSEVNKLNLELVKDIASEMFENMVVLTTYWNKGEGSGANQVAHRDTTRGNLAVVISPLKRYEEYEEKLIAEVDFKPLVNGKVQFKRFGVFSHPEMAKKVGVTSSLTVIQEAIERNSPDTLQVRCETSVTNSLSNTTVAKRLRDRLEEVMKKEEEEMALKHLQPEEVSDQGCRPGLN